MKYEEELANRKEGKYYARWAAVRNVGVFTKTS